MLKNLQTAIMTKYNSSAGATLRGLVQGMFEDEAPSTVVLGTQTGTEIEDSVKPFIVFTTILTTLDQDFCANFFYPLVQFSLFGDANNKSSIDLLTAQDAFLTLFGDTILTLANGYTMIRADTVGQRKFKDVDKMWNIVTEIQYIVQKDR